MRIDADALQALAELADDADRTAEWPARSWEVCRRAGVLGWSIPERFGGRELGAVERLIGYERLAGMCLTMAFILSQRDAAIRRVSEWGSDDVCCPLRPLAEGATFATVGISHLTTSRQHLAPALTARFADGADDGPCRLDGYSPWVTGAARADWFLLGATVADGRQALFIVPSRTPGLTVGPALDLSALAGSLTASVRCDGVEVGGEALLAGPAPQVLTTGKGSAGGLETSCLALGLAGAAIDFLHREASARPELAVGTAAFEEARRVLRRRLHRASVEPPAPAELVALRVRANQLVLRATQAGLLAGKGSGFVRPHPAQRWARQALFFLVWSCPRPAAEAALNDFLPSADGDGE